VPKVPGEEFPQIFDEVWRRYRDFFYVANMHGYDWEALRAQYAPLVAHVRHRSDLNYVLGEMIAELSVGTPTSRAATPERHRDPRRRCRAGARVRPAAGRYRIAAVLRGENDDEMYRSPATAVGVDVREGDYLLAIDGESCSPT
jgi:tricorn protease